MACCPLQGKVHVWASWFDTILETASVIAAAADGAVVVFELPAEFSLLQTNNKFSLQIPKAMLLRELRRTRMYQFDLQNDGRENVHISSSLLYIYFILRLQTKLHKLRSEIYYLHSPFDWFAFEQIEFTVFAWAHSVWCSSVNLSCNFNLLMYLSLRLFHSRSAWGHFTELSKLFAATSTECTKADEFLANTLSGRLGHADSEVSRSLKLSHNTHARHSNGRKVLHKFTSY